MNDTHGEEGTGWYGFDLDGTLAVYDKWRGIDHIGEPVEPMVDLLNGMRKEGKVVKILTARVAPRSNTDRKMNPYPTDNDVLYAVGKVAYEKHSDIYMKPFWSAMEFVQDWCLRNLGFIPEITHEKDHLMLCLYDDRVKQVVPNEGTLVEDVVDGYRVTSEKAVRELRRVDDWCIFLAAVAFAEFVALVAMCAVLLAK